MATARSTRAGTRPTHILSVHHVHEGAGLSETAWDLGFLASGRCSSSVAGCSRSDESRFG